MNEFKPALRWSHRVIVRIPSNEAPEGGQASPCEYPASLEASTATAATGNATPTGDDVIT
jgi:hypothetical protein